MSAAIIWEDLRIGYNRKFNCNHKTIKDFLEKMYKETKSTTKIGRILGVSSVTVLNKLKELKIEINSRGGLNHSPSKEFIFLNIHPDRMEKMTKREISRLCNMSISYIEKLAKKHNRKYIQVLNGGRFYAERVRSQFYSS
jgi:hypothetical protein